MIKFKLTEIADDIYNKFNEVEQNEVVSQLLKRHQHASVVAEDKITAVGTFKDFIVNSSNKYIPIIRIMDSDLTDLLTFTRTVEKDTLDASETDSIADAAEDNVLIKENDTPDGVNQDLTLDTYLSRAERQKSEIGERKGNVKIEREANELLKDLDRNQALLIIGQLNNLIKNQYTLWLNEIDKELLIYELN